MKTPHEPKFYELFPSVHFTDKENLPTRFSHINTSRENPQFEFSEE